MRAVHRGSTTYPAKTRSHPLGLDAHSKTLLQHSTTACTWWCAWTCRPNVALRSNMLHWIATCRTGLQRVALQCNVLHWPAMQSACLDLPPRALVADAHTHHPLQHQSIADSAVGGRGCSHALLRHASPHSFATGRFPTHSTVSVSSCTRTALHRTAPHCRAGTTPCTVGWCGGPRRLRVSGEPRVTCRVACCHVACCMLAPRTLHSRAE